MLTLKYITENTEDVILRLAKKHFDGREVIEKVVALDKERKAAQGAADNALSQVNQLSKQVGDCFKQGKADEANAIKAQIAQIKEESKVLSEKQESLEKEILAFNWADDATFLEWYKNMMISGGFCDDYGAVEDEEDWEGCLTANGTDKAAFNQEALTLYSNLKSQYDTYVGQNYYDYEEECLSFIQLLEEKGIVFCSKEDIDLLIKSNMLDNGMKEECMEKREIDWQMLDESMYSEYVGD